VWFFGRPVHGRAARTATVIGASPIASILPPTAAVLAGKPAKPYMQVDALIGIVCID